MSGEVTAPRRWATVVVVGALVSVSAVLVALTLRQPAVATYAPTPPVATDAGRALVGPVVYTVDATDAEAWRHFSFKLGSVVERHAQWDLAFRRYQILANGGPRYAGAGGIADLGPVAFDEVHSVPQTGYQVTENNPDPRNAAIASWYRYGFFSHVLSPKPHVWAVRTSDGRYAKIELLSYYCARAEPGCVTFRYVYQGDGSLLVAPPRTATR